MQEWLLLKLYTSEFQRGGKNRKAGEKETVITMNKWVTAKHPRNTTSKHRHKYYQFKHLTKYAERNSFSKQLMQSLMITKIRSYNWTRRDLQGYPGYSQESKEEEQRAEGYFLKSLYFLLWLKLKEPKCACMTWTTNGHKGWKVKSTGAYLMSGGWVCFAN